MSQNPEPEAGSEKVQSAATTLFDLRTIIAVLFGAYGVVLTLMGLFWTTQADLDQAGGINLNLWTGVAMLILAALFLTWVRLSPPLTAEAQEQDEE
jgi:FtsH-binding integral membrane protein